MRRRTIIRNDLTYIVSQMFDSVGEPFLVRLQHPILIALVRHPAVVDVHVLVASVPVALGNHQVGHALEQCLADALIRILAAVRYAPVSLPAHPTHRWPVRKTIVQCVNYQRGTDEERS